MAPSLETAFRRASPRLNPRPIAPLGAAIMTAIALFWLVAFVSAFRSHGLAAWSIGVAFIVYDLGHLLFVGAQARKLFAAAPAARPPSPVSVGVVVAAYNEAAALAPTLDALLAQSRPPDHIILADDGSDDDSAAVLMARYGLTAPSLGACAQSPIAPTIYWLRLPHRGKARALNAALEHVATEIFVTVDADTRLAPDAIAAIRVAFGADPALVVGGGVLEPRCRGGAEAIALQTFQRFEYIRNFLGRFAWSELDALLLISGAFAGFRTSAVREVGGFDPECLVEDYELIHRLHRAARERGGPAKVRILGRAFASTDAPATIPAFLRQRRRWFAGFLQTQSWNRDIVGDPRYGALGMAMLPFKCLDAAAPLYGLAAFGLFAAFVATGRVGVLVPATGLALAKLGFDLVNMAYSLEAYRRWTGARTLRRLGLAAACLLIEPLTFQPLRQIGAAAGWAAWLGGRMEWGRLSRRAGPQERAPRNSSTPSL
jgi:cellulose synthase/poly-beta-1,6-N-acetylglucosamine synthase-like glycosyltransferase